MKEKTYVDDIDRSMYDFRNEEKDAYKVKEGLTPAIVEQISKEKNDPAWMQLFRLQSLQIYNSMEIPNWGPPIDELNMDQIVTYVRPNTKMSAKWSEVPDDIKDTFERLGIPQAERKSLAGVGAQYDSELVYHNVKDSVAAEGVVYTDMESALKGGATCVQLREKHLDPQAFLTEAKRFVALCREQGALSIINDSAEIAAQAGADGVHVGQGDLEASHARALLGPDKLIGVSAHTVEEALRAQAAGADYLGVGAAFVTGTKADASPISRETIRAITAAVNIPVVAIGGISQNNILQLKGCGLDGVAVVSALFAQPDVQAAARELKRLSEEMVR